jgi:shikimate dehydrogenase
VISGRTGILGVIGHPVSHSGSPAMHNAALESTGLDYVYVAFTVPPEGAEGVGDAMRALNIRGLNVTVPHKQTVISCLDEVSQEAQAIGAVNTIDHRDGRLYGHNTDAYGLVASLREEGGLQRLPAKVALLGAGGAARAILYALLAAEEVEHVALLNRTIARAESLAMDLNAGSRVTVQPLAETTALADAGLVINSTSIGMEPDAEASPLGDGAGLHDGMVVVDIVYKPLETRLLQQARVAGARTVDGLGMLVHQGARAFELWTGVAPPVDVMRNALTQLN